MSMMGGPRGLLGSSVTEPPAQAKHKCVCPYEEKILHTGMGGDEDNTHTEGSGVLAGQVLGTDQADHEKIFTKGNS